MQEAFRIHGVVAVKEGLDAAAMTQAESAFQWSLANPGPYCAPVLGGLEGSFYQDHANPKAVPEYSRLLRETGLATLVANLLGSKNLWLLYEQIWLKEGPARRRTPWHQDLAYVPMGGTHLAVVWLTLDSVDKSESLEFVQGSHLGPLYNPTAFNGADPAAAMFEPGVWPALPDIEADRSRWPIVSWPIVPGDVIVFHPGLLHGGAATRGGACRRTISLRLFGDDSYCDSRPQLGLAEIDTLEYDRGTQDPMTAMARARPGTPFRHPDFAKIF